jgi:heme ABC exporter ATP-binding subunit CcmA
VSPMIDVRGLVKAFGLKAVLRGFDFHVEPGEFVALLGPNGAGKTTFIRILASLSRPTAGHVSIEGLKLPEEAGRVRRRLGVVAHQPLLYGDLSAEENLRFFGRMYGVEKIPDRLNEVLETVGLTAARRELVRNFSRGMQQRLSIGRAILHNPSLLLFDEPFTGLDQDASAMLDGLLSEVASHGRTVVMTSHDLERSARLASRVDILSRGKLAASLSGAHLGPKQLVEAYRAVTHA